MKKLLAVILVLSMTLVAFVGCAKEQSAPAPAPAPQDQPNDEPKQDEPKQDEPKQEEPLAEGEVKTGLAVVTSVEKSTDATADTEGVSESDSIVVAVTVDKDGKVVKAAMDIAQTAIKFNAEGKVTSDLAAVYKSKQELKEDYGMKKASKIGKEWYEQANAFADYAVGKTATEIGCIEADDADVVSSVTVEIDGFKDAFLKAIANAENLGAQAGDKLGIAINTKIDGSIDAADGKDGMTQAYSLYAATTFDADGKVTSSIFNGSQANVNFDAAGKITTDLTAPVLSKNELKEAYGMKKASKIGKEWYEQAASFAEYVVGKTSPDVVCIATDDGGHATDADLVSSVTFSIGTFQTLVDKAYSTAK